MGNPGPSVHLRSSARTNIGQVRENNEDNIHLWARDTFVLAVVADGMGGAAAGEEASRLAVEAVKSGFVQGDGTALETLGDVQLSEQLRAIVQDANDRIVAKALSSPEYRGMGTTVTLAFVRGMSAVFAHVGDSRAYLVDSDGDITQITSDHSFVEALLSAGHITPEQADEHPMRNVLYRALGQADEIDVDLYYKRLRVGDRLVLCSDGLTRHVKPREIALMTLGSPDPDTVSQKLIDLANERGGEDNVSVIIISVEGSPGEQQAEAVQDDEDETLLLRDRADPPGAEAAAETPKSDDVKMTAERLSDDDESVDETTLPLPAGSSRAVTRPSHIRPRPSAHERHPAPGDLPYEKQGEGHDTLKPEQ